MKKYVVILKAITLVLTKIDKMSRLFTCLLITLIMSCSYKYETVNHTGYQSGDLIHTVILKLKPEATEHRIEEIITELKSLSSIKETKCLQVATQAHTSDPRAKTDYHIILQIAFDNEEELQSYSTHPYHLEVRSGLKNDLAQVPVVYDYWIE